MEKLIAQVAKSLTNGGIVSLPTETVYSLSVNALNDSAIKKLYNLKGRRQDNPLSLFVGSIDAAREIVIFNKNAQILAEAFFPGPITLILPKKENTKISKFINEGINTLAVRMPRHDTTLQILNNVNFPVVGTSANPSGLSPALNAEGVRKYFPRGVDMIIDGGACDIGIASTIINLTGEKPLLVRKGWIDLPEIEKILGI